MVVEVDFQPIIEAYFPGSNSYQILPLGEGNINDTYRLEVDQDSFLLQKINSSIFKAPEVLLENHQLITQHTAQHLDNLQLPALIKTTSGQLAHIDSSGEYWRVITFLMGTYSVEYISNVGQVAEAANATGRFLAALNQTPTPDLGATIPGFHDFPKRYQYFLQIVEQAPSERKQAAANSIAFLRHWAPSIPNYHTLNLPKRLVHNDPKIGNVLFNHKDHVIAVIDWDTVMPGTLLTDFGDMVRTMVVTAGEDEADTQLIGINIDYFTALCQHFFPPLKSLLTPLEKQYLLSGAFYIVLEQMLRFLQDYLQGDVYYKIQYPEHNLVRANNQQALFQALKNQASDLEAIIQMHI